MPWTYFSLLTHRIEWIVSDYSHVESYRSCYIALMQISNNLRGWHSSKGANKSPGPILNLVHSMAGRNCPRLGSHTVHPRVHTLLISLRDTPSDTGSLLLLVEHTQDAVCGHILCHSRLVSMILAPELCFHSTVLTLCCCRTVGDLLFICVLNTYIVGFFFFFFFSPCTSVGHSYQSTSLRNSGGVF